MWKDLTSKKKKPKIKAESKAGSKKHKSADGGNNQLKMELA